MSTPDDALMRPILAPVIARLETMAAEDAARYTDPRALTRARELTAIARELQEAITRLAQAPRATGATPALVGDERLFRR